MRDNALLVVKRKTNQWSRLITNRLYQDLTFNGHLFQTLIHKCLLFIHSSFKSHWVEFHSTDASIFILQYLCRIQKISENELLLTVIENLLIMIFILNSSEILQ